MLGVAKGHAIGPTVIKHHVELDIELVEIDRHPDPLVEAGQAEVAVALHGGPAIGGEVVELRIPSRRRLERTI